MEDLNVVDSIMAGTAGTQPCVGCSGYAVNIAAAIAIIIIGLIVARVIPIR